MPNSYRFGPFRLDQDLCLLYRDDVPVALGQRAVTLLQLMLERPGETVAKNALIDAAWPDVVVEESNLSVQIATLRKALGEGGGDGWVKTLPRRGYCYVGPAVSRVSGSAAIPEAASMPDLPGKPSIAVLPFTNMSDDPQQRYFADGVADEIVTGLSRIKWLFVIGRSSTSRYEDQSADLKLVARHLGVRYVMQGSVRKAADRVRITCQLADAASEAQVWAERYDRRLDDIFALQDDIATSVVGAMEPGLRRVEIERVKRKRPDSLDAYDLVLRSQHDVYSGMPEQVNAALVLLERALALDPTYALAHAYSAMCHHCLFLRAGLREERRKASIDHARLAIVHGQDDALALTFAGFSIGMDEHDHATAFTTLEAALAISPSSAITYIVGGVMFGWQGQAARAIEWGERALRLSPFDAWAWSACHALALGHFHLAGYDAAARAAYKAVQLNPIHSISHMLLAAALTKLGRNEEAKAAAARVMELQPGFRFGRQFAGVDCEPVLAATLGKELRAVGLPE